jgi:hypothetical protein
MALIQFAYVDNRSTNLEHFSLQLVSQTQGDLHCITYHWIHELYTIVFGWIVTRSDHDSDGLPIQLSRPHCCKQSHTKHNRIQ